MSWSPKRTLAQTDEILCAPGSLHELEICQVDGRLYRVYKNLWPSLRAFWLWASSEYKEKTYLVFEEQRWTYGQIFERSVKAASIFRAFGVLKGDRVGICSRNYPEYLVVFWACQLIGAVSVLSNAWLPLGALHYCLTSTQCKLIILDSERADRLEPVTAKLAREAGTIAFLVLAPHEGKGIWNGMECWDRTIDNFRGDTHDIFDFDPNIIPEDNATVIFTSGTTGLPKGVLSTQRSFLTNVLNVLVGSQRAILRRGDSLPPLGTGPQKGVLVSVPFFHVTGSTSLSMMATFTGMKIILIRKWIPEEAARLIKQENVGVAGGVPSMVSDLADSSAAGYPLDSLLFGGAPAHDLLAGKARKAFPSATMSQAYGLTETNSVAVCIAGVDYESRPASTGRPTPVNDLLIMKNGKSLLPGEVGEVWLRGPNVMREYWRDPEATAKVITPDGWLKTGDLGLVDKEGFLYIRDRIKDIIIRGGENVDSVSVENALYADHRISEVAAVGVPDERLGELVAAVVSIKPQFANQVTEESLINQARQSLPTFAVPVMVIMHTKRFELTPSGKILKGELRKIARNEWMRRCATGAEPLSKL